MRNLLCMVFLLVFVFAAQGQQRIFVPVCAGTNDTARFTAIIATMGANTGTIRLPYKSGTRCAVNTLTIPANVTLDNTDGTGIRVNIGQTLNPMGPLVSPVGKQFFYNATAGLGTVSFTANATLRGVHSEWWGTGGAATTAAGVAVATLGPAPNFSANPTDPLAGTSGTPSNVNKYVTETDTRLLGFNAVNVARQATGGAGTSGSPYTGWDTAITWNSNTTYEFGSYHYSYTTPIVITDKTNVRLIGNGPGISVLHFNGTGVAIKMESTIISGHYGGAVKDIEIIGNPNATTGLLTIGHHHMQISNVKVREVSNKCFHVKWGIVNEYSTLRCTHNEEPFPVTRPLNGFFTEKRNNGETFQGNSLTNLIIEGTAGDGIVLNDAWQNTINAGTSEGNMGGGITIASTCRSNTIIGTDFEANTGTDVVINGDSNILLNVLSAGLVNIVSGKDNQIIGGQMQRIAVGAAAVDTILYRPSFNLVDATGGITDASNSLQWMTKARRLDTGAPGTPVTAFTLLNAWVNYGAPNATAGYYEQGFSVILRGAIKSGVTGTHIATLPIGKRPAQIRQFNVRAGSGFGTLTIQTTGNIVFDNINGDTSVIFLDGLMFDIP